MTWRIPQRVIKAIKTVSFCHDFDEIKFITLFSHENLEVNYYSFKSNYFDIGIPLFNLYLLRYTSCKIRKIS